MKRALSLLLSVILSITAMSAGIFATAEGEEIDWIEAVAQRKLIEDVDVEKTWFYNSETQQDIEYYKYNINLAEPLITVHYKNGSSEKVEYVLNQPQGSYATIIDPQSYNKNWKVGKNTIAGNYRGYNFDFEIEVISNPVESITISETGKLFEEVDGSWQEETANQKWFRYDLCLNSKNLIVHFKNGENISWDSIDMIDKFGKYYSWSYDDTNQSYENQWIAGNTYNTTVTFMGKTAEFNVEILENPIESITVNSEKKCIEEIDGSFTTDYEGRTWFKYYSNNMSNITVNFKDGRSVPYYSINTNELFGRYLQCRTEDNQSYDNQWGLGTHKVKAEFMGRTAEYAVEVVENPVESISVKPTASAKCVENVDGAWNYYENNKWFEYRYCISHESIIVNFKDKRSIPLNSIDTNTEFGEYYGLSYGDNQSYDNQWGLGTHKVTVEFMGRTAEYDVEVVENPIDRIEAKATKAISENIDGWWEYSENGKWFRYDLNACKPIITVYYKNGDYCDAQYIERNLSINDGQSAETPWTVGENTVTVSYMGVSTAFGVSVEEYTGGTEFGFVDENGKIYITNYYGSNTDVIIPAAIGGNPVVGITDLKNKNGVGAENIISLTIPDSVTSVTAAAFYSLSNLETLTLGSGIKNLKSQIFTYCTQLSKINVSPNNPNYVSENGVVFTKDKTAVVAYPLGRTADFALPKETTDISIFSEYPFNSVNIIVPDNSDGFIKEGGITYSIDMSAVISCDREKSGFYNMPSTVTRIYDGAFSGCEKITGVRFSNKITSITYQAFADCWSLLSVELPSSLKTIENQAFVRCDNIKELNFPEGLEKIGYGAFCFNYKLESINIPSSLQSIEGVAFAFTAITELTIPNTLKSIGNGAFSQNYALKKVTLPQSDLKIYEKAFFNCGIEELTIPAKLELAGPEIFQCNNSLKKVTVETGQTLAEDIFNDCSALQSVTLPNGLESIAKGAFSECKSLKNINLPLSLKEIEDSAFSESGLTSIDIPDSVEYIGDSAFEQCEITKVRLPKSLKSTGKYIFAYCPITEIDFNGYSKSDYCAFLGTAIKELVLPDSVTTIAYRSFADCSELIKIEIPDTVISIEANSFENTAWEKAQANGALYLNKALYLYKGSLKDSDRTLKVKDGTKIISSYWAYYSDPSVTTGLSAVILPNSFERIDNYSFAGCRALREINLPDRLCRIGDRAFGGCDGIKKLYLPSALTEIGKSAFAGCTSLTEITVSPDNPNYSSTDGLLYDKSGKTLISCPAGKTGELVIPEGVEAIADFAFDHCKNLSKVIIPESVTSIGKYAIGYDKIDIAVWQYELVHNNIYYGYYGDSIQPEALKNNYNTVFETKSETVKSYIDNIAAEKCNTHRFTQWLTIKEPTCELSGEEVKVCNVCESYITRETDPKGHSYSGEYIVDKTPTCTEDGQLSKRCSDCGILVPDSVIIIKAAGHKFGNWATVKTPSCCFDGERVHECEVCSTKETENIPAEHRRGLWYWVIKPQKNNGTGFKSADCEDCHEKRIETVQATELDNVGDLNNDNAINIKDIINIKKLLAEPYAYRREADLNRDGSLNSADMAILRQYLLSILKSL